MARSTRSSSSCRERHAQRRPGARACARLAAIELQLAADPDNEGSGTLRMIAWRFVRRETAYRSNLAAKPAKVSERLREFYQDFV